MKGIDPKWTALLTAVVALEIAIGHGTVSLTNAVPAAWIPVVQAWCNILAFCGTSIATGMSLYSSNASGLMVGTGPGVLQVTKVLIVGFVVSMLLMPNPAAADPIADAKAKLNAFNSKIAKPVTTSTVTAPAAAPATSGVTTLDQLMNKLAVIETKVVTDVIADIQAADADAATVITPATATAPTAVRDPISHACYPAAIEFLQTLPVATPTTGTLVAVQLFQKKRDFIMQLQAGLPSYLKIGCAALIGDEAKVFVTLMGMVGVTVATGGMAGLLPVTTILPALPALAL